MRARPSIRAGLTLSLIGMLGPALLQAADVPLHQQAHLRRPVALAQVGPWLLVANRDAGSISLIDRARRRVVAERPVAEQLIAMAGLADTNSVLAVDPVGRQILWLSVTADQLHVIARHAIAGDPVGLAVSPDGRWAAVTTRWARQLWLLRLSPGDGASPARLERERVIDLPFAPRLAAFYPDGDRLVVADAFSSHLAVLSLHSPDALTRLRIPGHNIGGLALDPHSNELVVAHQTLTSFVPTTRDHVFWGNVLGNFVRVIPPEQLPREAAHSKIPVVHGGLYPLGQDQIGSGDPQGILRLSNGQMVVALAGIHQVGIIDGPARPVRRVTVGQRPTTLLAAAATQIYVANQFDDSVSIVDLPQGVQLDVIRLGPQPALTPAQHGEVLFYDARLTLDRWFSCHSCHPDGHTSGQQNDNLGDDSYGAPKQIPSLLGTSDTAPWAWNGSQLDLTSQVRKSMHLTMHGNEEDTIREEDVMALVAFLQTLKPPPSVQAARGEHPDNTSWQKGRTLFHSLACDACHVPPTYTSRDTYDVGLQDEAGQTAFNPPSLRGVGQRQRFLHDGRAPTLRDVFATHGHAHTDTLSPTDLDHLLTFLQSL